jgi:hypothetical protein
MRLLMTKHCAETAHVQTRRCNPPWYLSTAVYHAALIRGTNIA